MTRQKPRRSPPATPRARRDAVSPQVAEAYKAELLERLLHNRALVAEKARQAGLVEQADGSWSDPAATPAGLTAPRSCSPPADA